MAEDQKPIQPSAAHAGSSPGSGATPPVARTPAAPAPGNIPVATDAAKSSAAFGRAGNKFKFPVESPEGQKERRDAEAERKRAARAVAARMVEPPPLPPAGARLGGEPASPLSDGTGPEPGASSAPGDAPPVPWQPEVLSDLVSELLDAVEESRVESFLEKCTEAKLMPKLIKEIEADVRFPKMAKIMLKRSLPRMAAKWLNKTGVSAEYQDELSVLSAVVLIVQSDRKSSAKLDEIIASQKPAAPPETKTKQP